MRDRCKIDSRVRCSVEPRFAGRVALVTGASRGIGFATARRLAREGASVLMNARSAERLRAAEQALAGEGLDVATMPLSLFDPNAPEEIVAATVDRFGSIDLVANVVGTNSYAGSLLAIPEQKFARSVVGNSWPMVGLVRAAVDRGLPRGGAVVAISSIGARQVHPRFGHYSAGKAALESVVCNLARELGPRGVRLNVVAPGLVTTDMSRALWEGPRGRAEAELLPLQRLGEPEDIAGAITFLLSDESSWITGVTLHVDGGRMLVGGESLDELGVYEPNVTANGA